MITESIILGGCMVISAFMITAAMVNKKSSPLKSKLLRQINELRQADDLEAKDKIWLQRFESLVRNG